MIVILANEFANQNKQIERKGVKQTIPDYTYLKLVLKISAIINLLSAYTIKSTEGNKTVLWLFTSMKKQLKLFLLSLSFVGLGESCFSQNLDSLLAEVSKDTSVLSQYQLWSEIAATYQSRNNDAGFKDAIQKVLAASFELKNDTLIAGVYTYLGSYYEAKPDFKSSIEYHLKSLSILQRLNHKPGICLTSEQIAVVYKQLRNRGESIKYLKKAESLINEEAIRGTWIERAIYANLAEVYLFLSDNQVDSAYFYMKKAEKVLQKEDVFGNSRVLLIKGYINLQKGNTNIAEKYFKEGIEYSKLNNEKTNEIENLNGYSKLLLEVKRLGEAKQYALNSLFRQNEFGLKAGTLKIDVTNILQKIYKELNQYDSAYYYSNLRDTFKDTVYNEAILNSIQDLTFDKKIDETEEAFLRQQEKKDIRQRNIRNSIGVGLFAALIFSVIVYRQRNKIYKEKRKSDALLLNILPAEVAEELKSKGSADAKHFNNVTVLFTDFVNFTSISEQMSPTELVAEIHRNFTAFDTIIDHNGLEKIKTIGDAYMAVCGLPAAHPDHAKKVVKAALEIRDYIERKNGKFKIRIGVNSGPVVAGIVGVKKFAYDIWGDTVNSASRMESTSEPGKINISLSTYDLVKNQFNCSYRGKLPSKGKGELDMYFVESEI